MTKVETIAVKIEGHPAPHVLINKSDFDPKKHTPLDQEKPKRGRPAKAKED